VLQQIPPKELQLRNKIGISKKKKLEFQIYLDYFYSKKADCSWLDFKW